LFFDAGLQELKNSIQVYSIIEKDEVEFSKFISDQILIPYLAIIEKSQNKILAKYLK